LGHGENSVFEVEQELAQLRQKHNVTTRLTCRIAPWHRHMEESWALPKYARTSKMNCSTSTA
jgi:hypothetical protein